MTPPTKEQELAWCAPVKAAMMLLVVLYHSYLTWSGGWFAEPAEPCWQLGLFARWLNTFHVPVFVFCSGYIWCYLKRETGRYSDPRAVLAKKARRLLVPYAFVCLVWAVPFWVIFFGPGQVVEKYVLAGGPSQLWFLVMLFVEFALFEALWAVFGERLVLERARFACAAALAYLAGLAAGALMPVNVAQVASALQYAPLFWLGAAFRAADTSRFWRVPLPAFAAANAALFALSEAAGAALSGLPGAAVSALLWPAVRVAGVAMAVSAAGRLCPRPGCDRARLSRGGRSRGQRHAGLPVPPAARVGRARVRQRARGAARPGGARLLRVLAFRVVGDLHRSRTFQGDTLSYREVANV